MMDKKKEEFEKMMSRKSGLMIHPTGETKGAPKVTKKKATKKK